MSDRNPGGSAAVPEPEPIIDEEELRRLNEDMIKSDLITPDRLYVELALLKDLNIGTLLSFREEKKAVDPACWPMLYQSILDGLPAYRARKFDDLIHYFPKFSLTNIELQARKRDPDWASQIFFDAPITKFIDTLRAQIAVNVNHSAVIGKRDPIDLTINTYPLQLNAANCHLIARYFSELLGVRVAAFYRDLTKLTLADILPFDEVYSYHLKEIFDHKDILAGYTALKFIRKRLYVPRLFGNSFIANKDTEQEERVIKSRCDILTMFTFLPTQLCSAESP